MQQSRGLVTSEPGRLEALRARHAALQSEIDEELKRPATTGEILMDLKLKKLKIKEEISQEEKRTA